MVEIYTLEDIYYMLSFLGIIMIVFGIKMWISFNQLIGKKPKKKK